MKLNPKNLLPIISGLIICAAITIICSSSLSFHASYPHYPLTKGWDVSIDTESYQDVDIASFYKILDAKLMKGDKITMTVTLPDLGSIPDPVVMFKSKYTTLTCYVDDKLIYDFGRDYYEKGKFLGKNFHFIQLPSNYAGQTFKVEMIASENNAFDRLPEVQIGSQVDLEGALIHEYMLIISTGLFLLIFGLSFLCITLLFVSIVPEVINLLISSLLCMNLGIWLLSYYNIMGFFIHVPFETEVAYFTLYLIVPYCLLILFFMQKNVFKKPYIVISFIAIGIIGVQIILHLFFKIHLRSTLPLYHLSGITLVILIIYCYRNNIINKNFTPSSLIQMSGLAVFIFTGFIHLILYTMDSLHIDYPESVGRIPISAGCIFFALCQMANYLIYITESYARRIEFASLTHLAYADGLTNLPNRASADRFLKTLDESNSDYCIISIDLNNLKTVNDKFGHLTGDKYIKDFSKVLTNTFDASALCARIGGDEFLVVIKELSGINVGALIDRMNSALEVMNAIYSEYKRSVASGYAFKHECPDGKSHEVYLLADQRMYQNKRKMHDALSAEARL